MNSLTSSTSKPSQLPPPRPPRDATLESGRTAPSPPASSAKPLRASNFGGVSLASLDSNSSSSSTTSSASSTNDAASISSAASTASNASASSSSSSTSSSASPSSPRLRRTRSKSGGPTSSTIDSVSSSELGSEDGSPRARSRSGSGGRDDRKRVRAGSKGGDDANANTNAAAGVGGSVVRFLKSTLHAQHASGDVISSTTASTQFSEGTSTAEALNLSSSVFSSSGRRATVAFSAPPVASFDPAMTGTSPSSPVGSVAVPRSASSGQPLSPMQKAKLGIPLMAALNPTSGVFPPKESVTSPVTPRRTGLGSNSVVRRGKSKFLLPEFGVDLKELATSRYNAVRGIPFVLFDCLNYLVEEKGALDNMRLFTARVRDDDVKELRALLEQGGSTYEAEKEVYAVAEVVKQFLRELPDPLCTAELIDQWIAAAERPTLEERKRALKRVAFVQLPETNRVVLHYLLSFLYLYTLVPAHATKNKANITAVADTFGPLIFRAPDATTAVTSSSSTTNPVASPELVAPTTPAPGSSGSAELPATPKVPSPRSGPSALLSRSAPLPASPLVSSSSAPAQVDAAEQPASHSIVTAATTKEIAPEMARLLCQTLLEDLPTMFPLLPNMCPSLPYVPMFGLPLPHIMQTQADKHPALKIPHFIHQALARLREDKDLHKEGLFRLSGNAELVNRARALLDHGQELDVNLLSRDEVASLMKAFIRELPQPLFFAVPAMQWIATLGLKDDENMMAEELRRLLDQLPPHNLDLWREVVHFLHEITLQAEVNKMSPVNLGIVWGPNVFWDEQTLPVLAMNDVVANMIRLRPAIFPEPLSPRSPGASGEMAALDSKGSGGREAANREQLLLSVLQPTEADLEAMRKFSVLRTKLYKKEAQEQRKARKGKEKEDKEKDKEKEESKSGAKPKDDVIRIVMAGPQCGKSCLVTRLRFNEFVEVEDPTIQDDHVHTLTVNDKQYTLKIRDISGDLALYSEFYPNWLAWGDGFMMVYNIGDAGTFAMLSNYKERILKAKEARAVPMCIVGTQMDQEDQREVLTSDGKKLAFDWKSAFTEASSESGENVESAFLLMVKEILNFGKEKEDTRLSRVERERLYQERRQAEEEAAAKRLEEEEEARKKAVESNVKIVKLALDVPGYQVERGQARVINAKYHSEDVRYEIENADHNIAWYKEYFMGKDHKNFCGMDPVLGPIIISAIREKTAWRVLYRSEKAVERMLIPLKDLPASAGRKEIIDYVDKRIALDAIKPIANAKLHKELLKFEEGCHVYRYKFGVLFCRQGQTKENDMFANNMSSIKFDKFLESIGEKIPLKGWKKYDGGLDVARGKTGEHSVFAELPSDIPERPYEVMYHVSTLLPHSKKDVQQLERKRHLGNDVVVIVFQAGDTIFDPTCIASEFNHVWFVVREETNPEFLPADRGDKKETYYRIEVVTKEGVAPISPYLPDPPVFAAGPEFTQMFLHKLINAENAAYHAPAFISKMKITRKVIFSNLIKEYKK